jgi:hypothetical protein
MKKDLPILKDRETILRSIRFYEGWLNFAFKDKLERGIEMIKNMDLYRKYMQELRGESLIIILINISLLTVTDHIIQFLLTSLIRRPQITWRHQQRNWVVWKNKTGEEWDNEFYILPRYWKPPDQSFQDRFDSTTGRKMNYTFDVMDSSLVLDFLRFLFK